MKNPATNGSSEMLGSRLVFLISQPRSGSTMLQSILAAHSKIETSSEPWVMLHPIYALRSQGHTAEYGSDLAHRALISFLDDGGRYDYTYDHALRSFASVLYGSKLSSSEKLLFLDKTPRYYFIIPELRRIFPCAKFLFLIRNPLSVLWSVLQTWVGSEWCRLHQYRHDLLTAPQAIVDGIGQLGGDAIVVHYEKLVTEPGRTVENTCDRLAIRFEPDMIHYGQFGARAYAFGDKGTVHAHSQPMAGRTEEWRKLANHTQTRRFAQDYLHALGPEVISKLGYSYGAMESVANMGDVEDHSLSVGLSLVTRPQSAWSGHQRLMYRTVVECQRYGPVAGPLRVLRAYLWAVLRSIAGT